MQYHEKKRTSMKRIYHCLYWLGFGASLAGASIVYKLWSDTEEAEDLIGLDRLTSWLQREDFSSSLFHLYSAWTNLRIWSYNLNTLSL